MSLGFIECLDCHKIIERKSWNHKRCESCQNLKERIDNRKWRKEHSEERKAYKKKWRKEHPEECREHDRKKYKEHSEECKARARAYYKKRQKLCPEINNSTQRKSRYGITEKQYQEKLKEQNYSCAICLNPFTEVKRAERPHVDHDHSCCPNKACGNCFRGLLCGLCNSMLGYAKDNPEILERAAQYLRRYKEDFMARDSGHINERRGQGSAPSKLGESGTEQCKNKSHESDISWGEGLALKSVHPGHEKHRVRDAKHVKGANAAAQAAHEKMENNQADGDGGW